jgi:hypothetical protein
MMKFYISSLRAGQGFTPPPFNDTRTFALKEQRSLGAYVFTGTYSKNPVTENILHTFFSGATHVFDTAKKARAIRSTDNGATHGAPFDIADPVEGGVQDVGGGYSNSGRFHLFYDVHESFAANVNHWAFYRYSDDDGTTWSQPVSLTLVAPELKGFRMLGKLIENNGVLLKPFYKGTDEGGFTTESARCILRSTDGGASWSSVIVERGAEYVNEGSVIAVDANTLIYAARKEANGRGYRLYKSTDNGLTWTVQGDTAFGESMTTSHPPHLERFLLDGKPVLAFYYVNRNTKEFKAVYGTPANVAAGVSGWNTATKISFMDFDNYPSLANNTAAAATSGYGMPCHVSNDLFAKGMQYTDYGLNVPTNILYYDLPTTHYQSLKATLFPVVT